MIQELIDYLNSEVLNEKFDEMPPIKMSGVINNMLKRALQGTDYFLVAEYMDKKEADAPEAVSHFTMLNANTILFKVKKNVGSAKGTPKAEVAKEKSEKILFR